MTRDNFGRTGATDNFPPDLFDNFPGGDEVANILWESYRHTMCDKCDNFPGWIIINPDQEKNETYDAEGA